MNDEYTIHLSITNVSVKGRKYDMKAIAVGYNDKYISLSELADSITITDKNGNNITDTIHPIIRIAMYKAATECSDVHI